MLFIVGGLKVNAFELDEPAAIIVSLFVASFHVVPVS